MLCQINFTQIKLNNSFLKKEKNKMNPTTPTFISQATQQSSSDLLPQLLHFLRPFTIFLASRLFPLLCQISCNEQLHWALAMLTVSVLLKALLAASNLPNRMLCSRWLQPVNQILAWILSFLRDFLCSLKYKEPHSG